MNFINNEKGLPNSLRSEFCKMLKNRIKKMITDSSAFELVIPKVLSSSYDESMDNVNLIMYLDISKVSSVASIMRCITDGLKGDFSGEYITEIEDNDNEVYEYRGFYSNVNEFYFTIRVMKDRASFDFYRKMEDFPDIQMGTLITSIYSYLASKYLEGESYSAKIRVDGAYIEKSYEVDGLTHVESILITRDFNELLNLLGFSERLNDSSKIFYKELTKFFKSCPFFSKDLISYLNGFDSCVLEKYKELLLNCEDETSLDRASKAQKFVDNILLMTDKEEILKRIEECDLKDAEDNIRECMLNFISTPYGKDLDKLSFLSLKYLNVLIKLFNMSLHQDDMKMFVNENESVKITRSTIMTDFREPFMSIKYENSSINFYLMPSITFDYRKLEFNLTVDAPESVSDEFVSQIADVIFTKFNFKQVIEIDDNEVMKYFALKR